MSSNEIKYSSKNPLQRVLIERFLKRITELVSTLQLESLLEVGTGEGFALEYLSKHGQLPVKTIGIDVSAKAVSLAKQKGLQSDFLEASALSLPFEDSSFDMVLCLEVLEHIDDYTKALREIMRVSSKTIILSVPWEPWFSYANALRGKNVQLYGRDPEHVNAWTKKSFNLFVSDKGYHVTKNRIIFPWQVVHLEKD